MLAPSFFQPFIGLVAGVDGGAEPDLRAERPGRATRAPGPLHCGVGGNWPVSRPLLQSLQLFDQSSILVHSL